MRKVLWRIFQITILFTACSFNALSQSRSLIIHNGATFNGNGIIVVKDSIKNNNSATELRITGSVILNGGDQTLVVNAGGGTLKFDVLSVRGSGEKRVVGTIAVAESLNVLAGVTFNIADDTVRIERSSKNSGTLTTNAQTVVEYIRDDGNQQTIMSGVLQGKVRLQGNSRKVLSGALTVDSLEHTGWGVTLNHPLTLNGKASFDSILTITSGTTLTFTNDSSTINRIGAIEENASLVATNAAVTIGSLGSHTGTIQGGSRRLTFLNPVTLTNGTITAGSGDVVFNSSVTAGGTALIQANQASDSLVFNGTLTFTSANAAVQLNGTGVASFVVTPQIVSPSNFVLSDASTVYYNGGSQLVLALNYGSLGLTSTGTKQFASGEIGIRRALIVQPGVTVDALTNFTTVNYNGSGAQTIAALRYANLTISNDRAGETVQLPASDTIKVAGTFTVSATNYGVDATGSVFEYNGDNLQTVTPFSYNNLVLSGAGEKVVAASQTVNGTIEQKQGTPVTVNSGVDLIVGGNVIAHNGFVNNGTITIGLE